MKRDVQDECYRADSSTIRERICELGHTIQKIVAKITAPADHILRRMLNEQLILGNGKAEAKDNIDISANSKVHMILMQHIATKKIRQLKATN